jgi:hypothetical protein
MDAMKQMLAAYFPDDNGSFKQVATNVFAEYAQSRSSPAWPNKLYGAPIMDLENLVQNAKMLLHDAGQPDAQIMEIVQRCSQMLSRIKNRVGEYLMSIESDEAGPNHAAD